MQELNLDILEREAKISLTKEEKERFTQDLTPFIERTKLLYDLVTEDIPAMRHPANISLSLREDKEDTQTSVTPQVLLKSTPYTKNNYIVVPKVISD